MHRRPFRARPLSLTQMRYLVKKQFLSVPIVRVGRSQRIVRSTWGGCDVRRAFVQTWSHAQAPHRICKVLRVSSSRSRRRFTGVKQAMRASSLTLGNSLVRWPATCARGASVVNHIRGGKDEYATTYRGRQEGLQPISPDFAALDRRYQRCGSSVKLRSASDLPACLPAWSLGLAERDDALRYGGALDILSDRVERVMEHHQLFALRAK